MSVKRLAIWGLGIVVIGVLIRILIIIFDGSPGGPIIVIQPTPDEKENLTAEHETTTSYSTRWYSGCRDLIGNPPEAQKEEYFGIPGRYSSRHGADKIVVTLKPESRGKYPFSLATFEANKFSLQLDSAKQPLTVELSAPTKIPTWNRDTQIVPYDGGKAIYRWSNELYGHIQKLTVTERDGPQAEVDVADLTSIAIEYRKPYLAKTCR